MINPSQFAERCFPYIRCSLEFYALLLVVTAIILACVALFLAISDRRALRKWEREHDALGSALKSDSTKSPE